MSALTSSSSLSRSTSKTSLNIDGATADQLLLRMPTCVNSTLEAIKTTKSTQAATKEVIAILGENSTLEKPKKTEIWNNGLNSLHMFNEISKSNLKQWQALLENLQTSFYIPPYLERHSNETEASYNARVAKAERDGFETLIKDFNEFLKEPLKGLSKEMRNELRQKLLNDTPDYSQLSKAACQVQKLKDNLTLRALVEEEQSNFSSYKDWSGVDADARRTTPYLKFLSAQIKAFLIQLNEKEGAYGKKDEFLTGAPKVLTNLHELHFLFLDLKTRVKAQIADYEKQIKTVQDDAAALSLTNTSALQRRLGVNPNELYFKGAIKDALSVHLTAKKDRLKLLLDDASQTLATYNEKSSTGFERMGNVRYGMYSNDQGNCPSVKRQATGILSTFIGSSNWHPEYVPNFVNELYDTNQFEKLLCAYKVIHAKKALEKEHGGQSTYAQALADAIPTVFPQDVLKLHGINGKIPTIVKNEKGEDVQKEILDASRHPFYLLLTAELSEGFLDLLPDLMPSEKKLREEEAKVAATATPKS